MRHGIHEPVFATAHGCVSRCGCCSRLQVLFGNALLSTDGDSFGQLRAVVAEFDRGHALLPTGGADLEAPFDADDTDAASPLRYRVVLHTGCAGVAFAFTRRDVAELRTLLEGAALLLEL